jgi:hypothetical protein
MAETRIPLALTEAVRALWRIPPPGPNNLLSDPRFVRLRDTCHNLYPKGGPQGPLDFALSSAVRVLGLPCWLVPANARLALAPEIAAARLDAAFRTSQTSHVCLCPLDLADDNVPALKFGPNSIRKFTTGELNALVDPPRLERVNPNWTFDAERFSECSWLVVEESRSVKQQPGGRPLTLLSATFDLNEDRTRIDPHRERFPSAVEAALFAVLTAPWEDWAEFPQNDWRGFRIPWVYLLSDDIFVWPSPPPSPDGLSWEPDFFHDEDGNVLLEQERPARLCPLNDTGAEVSTWLTDTAWSKLALARRSPLFKTPIAHFLVRAFLAEGIDEFLAHITTIEAAVGLQSDYGEARRKIRNLRKQPSATQRMVARISALLDEEAAGEEYRHCFQLRSEYLHGRQMEDIAGEDRIGARRLARRVVNGIIDAAVSERRPQSRNDFLDGLLDRGLQQFGH